MNEIYQYLLVTGTIGDIGSLLPLMASTQKNLSFCIANNAVQFCPNCKNGSNQKGNEKERCSHCTTVANLDFSSIRSISTTNISSLQKKQINGKETVKTPPGFQIRILKGKTRSVRKVSTDKIAKNESGAVKSVPSIRNKKKNQREHSDIASDVTHQQSVESVSINCVATESAKSVQNQNRNTANTQTNRMNEARKKTYLKSLQTTTKFPARKVKHDGKHEFLVYDDPVTDRKLYFRYFHTNKWGGVIYRCRDNKCRVIITTLRGYFLKDPTLLQHKCTVEKSNSGSPSIQSTLTKNKIDDLNFEPIGNGKLKVKRDFDIEPSSTVQQDQVANEISTEFPVEHENSASRDGILLYRNPITGQTFRFSHVCTNEFGMKTYKCIRTRQGAICTKDISVKDDYYLTNPLVGHSCDPYIKEEIEW